MNDILISVVIPMYNSEKSIIKCIESVLSQTKKDIIQEIIVVNDGSTDNSEKKIIEKFLENINNGFIKIISIPNSGVSKARNVGIKNSSGNWIAFLDSDDRWNVNKIEKQLNYIDKYPNIKFIGTGRNNDNVRFGSKIEDNLYKLNVRNQLKKYWPHTSTALIHKSVFEKVGTFDESRTHLEDGQLWLRIVAVFPIYYIVESLETAGDNKRSFGQSGLSANIKKMHEGCLININETYRKGHINLFEKYYYIIIEYIKYFRRIIITKTQ